jgi:DNA primase catalytic subunit
MDERILKYYSRKDVQRKILESSKDREVGVKYGEGGFGKRPDILQFESDIWEIAKNSATSFHVSVERWSNPLLLETGMNKKKQDEIRIGWDCILDIDTKFIEYSKLTAELLVDALKFHDIKNIGIKFSGGSGFHIGIPYESFPDKVDNKDTRLLFPDGVRVIAEYLKRMIEGPLREKILSTSSVYKISKSLGKEEKDLLINGLFDPFSIVEIDSVLIASRHLYRAPYSINEKKGLVSIPVKYEDLKNFDLNKAKIENVKTELDFLPKNVEGFEAAQLIIQAFDALKKQSFTLHEDKNTNIGRTYDLPKLAVKMEHWPNCIKKGLEGMKDGKKRFLFILMNFLKSLSWEFEGIEKIVNEWNKKNKEPLKEGYIISQINWHKQHREKMLPPNCVNKAYYADLGLKCSDIVCNRCKNPVNFSLMKLRSLKQNKKNRHRSSKKTENFIEIG